MAFKCVSLDKPFLYSSYHVVSYVTLNAPDFQYHYDIQKYYVRKCNVLYVLYLLLHVPDLLYGVTNQHRSAHSCSPNYTTWVLYLLIGYRSCYLLVFQYPNILATFRGWPLYWSIANQSSWRVLRYHPAGLRLCLSLRDDQSGDGVLLVA